MPAAPRHDGCRARRPSRKKREGRVDRGDCSPRPPCRSGRAGLPHPAPRITGSLCYIDGMHNDRLRQHVILEKLLKAIPLRVVALRTTVQPPMPCAADGGEEVLQRTPVPRHTEVLIVTA